MSIIHKKTADYSSNLRPMSEIVHMKIRFDDLAHVTTRAKIHKKNYGIYAGNFFF
jgi:hypothetical protein